MPSLASHERKHRAVWSCFYYGELIPTPTCFDWIISFFLPPDTPNTALYLCCVFLTNAQRPCNRVWFSAVFLVFVTLSTIPSLKVSLPLTSTNMHFSGFSAFLKTAFLCPLLSRSFPHPLKANFLSPVHSPLCFRWSTLLSDYKLHGRITLKSASPAHTSLLSTSLLFSCLLLISLWISQLWAPHV